MNTITTQTQVQAVPLADNDNDASNKIVRVNRKEHQLAKNRFGLKDASFAYGRRNSIRELVELRFGGPCDTDDADLIAEIIIPFIVEAATLHRHEDGSRRDPLEAAHFFLRRLLPAWSSSNSETLSGLVDAAIRRCAAAAAQNELTKAGHVRWLPSMTQLVGALLPTREEIRHLRLHGWGCIDPASPEERREADRLRKRAERAAKGATPRLASITAQKPWEAAGLSRATWYRRRGDGQPETPAAETDSSAPYTEKHGLDVFVSLAEPVNDDTIATAVA